MQETQRLTSENIFSDNKKKTAKNNSSENVPVFQTNSRHKLEQYIGYFLSEVKNQENKNIFQKHQTTTYSMSKGKKQGKTTTYSGSIKFQAQINLIPQDIGGVIASIHNI